MNKIKISIIISFLILPFSVFSQQNENITLSKKEIRKLRPAYINMSAGINNVLFRDFATSPLFYKGTPSTFSLSFLKKDQKKETETGISYTSGNCYTTYTEQFVLSNIKMISLYYSLLYKINSLSNEKWNLKTGGLLNITGDFRINERLDNFQVGYELLPTLFGSIKLTRDISTKTDKERKFLFIKYKSKQRIRNISYRLNIGILNNSYRNPYSYIGPSSMALNSELFDGYTFYYLSGFRLSSALNYTFALKNKNKIRLSYIWDAFTTSKGNCGKFQMSQQLFKISLLFNTNNK